MTSFNRLVKGVAFAGLGMALMALPAGAQDKPELRIGTIVAVTGGASALGAPERNAIELFEKNWLAKANLPFDVKVISYDDGSDPTKSVTLTRKLIEEDQVDVVVCCTTTPSSLAIIDTVTAAMVPMISMASSAAIVSPAADRPFTFKTPTTDRLMIERTVGHLKQEGVKKLAFLGQDDSYGESGLKELEKAAAAAGIEIVATERFNRQDTNFTPQALKAKQSQPDAVYIHAIPPSADLVHEAMLKVGYKGPIYHGAGSSIRAFIDLGKQNVEGAIVGVGALNVYDQLSESNPMRPVLADFAALYDEVYGQGKVDLFAGQSWDAVQLAVHAFAKALEAGADPKDLPAMRIAIKDALEQTKEYVGVNGVFNFSADDHLGLDSRSTFLSQVKGGKFVLIEE